MPAISTSHTRAEHPERGFTLLEVLVALSVVAVSFVALLGLHNRNIAVVSRDQERTVALLLARRAIAEMEVGEGFPEVGTTEGEVEGYPGFRWVREVRDTEMPDLREVRLRVYWGERERAGYTVLYYARDHREPQG